MRSSYSLALALLMLGGCAYQVQPASVRALNI